MRLLVSALLGVLNGGSLAGAIVLYSDATGQRPVHNQAAIGIFLLWFPLAFLVVAVTELIDRG